MQREQHEQNYERGKITRHLQKSVAEESGSGLKGKGPDWREGSGRAFLLGWESNLSSAGGRETKGCFIR